MKQKSVKIQRRKPKQARALKKYNAILDACTQLLLLQGYEKITILELSVESDVAVPTLYQYFENKEAIFIAWVDRVMDQVLTNVANMEATLTQIDLNEHIEPLVKTALFSVNYYRPGLQQLLSEVPNALSSKVIDRMESKTLSSVKGLYKHQFQKASDPLNLERRLLTLIRLITGYFVQAIMNERDINIHEESGDLACLVSLYLSHHNIT
ncbi:MAG: TetR/AcrR family transcriptional regulator [Pseudomonadales bacterium]|nr:TetR/AcrR family transcriptional regulator [Pseudomonadales bacterium]